MLADKYSFNYYKIDDYEMEHIEQATSDKEPTMYNYLQMNWDERLMRPPEKQAKELGYKIIYVNGENTIEQNIKKVENHFQLNENINKFK